MRATGHGSGNQKALAVDRAKSEFEEFAEAHNLRSAKLIGRAPMQARHR